MRPADGHDVRQGHLPCLVDEQHIHYLEIIGPRPKPRRASDHIGRARVQCIERSVIVGCGCDLAAVVAEIFILNSLEASHSEFCFLRGLDDFVQQFAG